MNSITLIGQIQGNARLIDTSKDKTIKFYEFILKVPRENHIKGEQEYDYFVIKHMINVLQEKFNLYDKTTIVVQGTIESHLFDDNIRSAEYDVWAEKIIYLTTRKTTQ
ncbi:single-strand-binding family protein [Mycoplasma feriruminatoris]|uniref:hypothetical protein n=2 Tax=Mycoplasma feriruminatoris TaxID=1179777 RepID=UPI00241F077D|nr:hypothetical protein [Mycoplasma feriruminatoris]WFQ91354.1 single-strand-binding family protein [Mycoplasma feriruminatoris]